jgi:hypothetical protein
LESFFFQGKVLFVAPHLVDGRADFNLQSR